MTQRAVAWCRLGVVLLGPTPCRPVRRDAAHTAAETTAISRAARAPSSGRAPRAPARDDLATRGVGRAWLNGREVGGTDPRYTHLEASHDSSRRLRRADGRASSCRVRAACARPGRAGLPQRTRRAQHSVDEKGGTWRLLPGAMDSGGHDGAYTFSTPSSPLLRPHHPQGINHVGWPALHSLDLERLPCIAPLLR